MKKLTNEEVVKQIFNDLLIFFDIETSIVLLYKIYKNRKED